MVIVNNTVFHGIEIVFSISAVWKSIVGLRGV